MKQQYEFPATGFVASAQNLGHKFWALTILFGVEYAWMIDPAGNYYLHARPREI